MNKFAKNALLLAFAASTVTTTLTSCKKRGSSVEEAQPGTGFQEPDKWTDPVEQTYNLLTFTLGSTDKTTLTSFQVATNNGTPFYVPAPTMENIAKAPTLAVIESDIIKKTPTSIVFKADAADILTNVNSKDKGTTIAKPKAGTGKLELAILKGDVILTDPEAVTKMNALIKSSVDNKPFAPKVQ